MRKTRNPATHDALTRLAATALDRTSEQRDKVVVEVAGYAGTDLVCYRAGHPPTLVARQQAAWQPLIDWRCCGSTRRSQSPRRHPGEQSPVSLKAFASAVAAHDDFRLTACIH